MKNMKQINIQSELYPKSKWSDKFVDFWHLSIRYNKLLAARLHSGQNWPPKTRLIINNKQLAALLTQSGQNRTLV